jgi:alanyl-tRNA synthetase
MNYTHLISDHIRSSCFIIADGTLPSGKQRGYILRRLIRRALSASLKLKINILNPDYYTQLVDSVVEIYRESYPEISQNRDKIIQVLIQESQKYDKSIEVGQKQWQKYLAKYGFYS